MEPKTSRGELLLREILRTNIDNDNVIYNCRELGIINDVTGKELEIDIFYPDYKLAFEFQGEEHYNVTGFADKELVEEIKRRDLIKEKFCRENSIVLITINAISLNYSIGRSLHRDIPDLKLFLYDRKNKEHVSTAKLLEWKCKEYRKYLNKTYEGHTSAKTDVRLWREKLKSQGIEIPTILRRKTKIPQEIRDIVESGKYEEWCIDLTNKILKSLYTRKYPPRNLGSLLHYLPDEMREKCSACDDDRLNKIAPKHMRITG